MSELEQGLRHKEDVLNLCRLMVRAEDPEHRIQILKVLEVWYYPRGSTLAQFLASWIVTKMSLVPITQSVQCCILEQDTLSPVLSTGSTKENVLT